MFGWAEESFDTFTTMWEDQCKGKKKCNFTWRKGDLPIDECQRTAVPYTYWKYLLVASCSNAEIAYISDVKVTKNLIGILVVFFDLIITFWYWCSILALKKFQEVTEAEVNGDIVLPQDYTVQIYQESHTESLKELPGVYYAWVENILQKESKELLDTNTGEVDENQNNVWNVNMALTSTGNLEYMKAMGNLLYDKKRLDKRLRLLQAKEKEPTSDILKIKQQLKEMKTKAKALVVKNSDPKTTPPEARYAYVQFQSMNGKDKFLKAMDIGCCTRCCMKCKKTDDLIAHKYMQGKWPAIAPATDPTLILWQNLGKGKIARCGRSTISNIFAGIILLAGFFLIVYIL